MRVRLMRGFFTLLFIALVSGGTWLAVYPAKWFLTEFGIIHALWLVPAYVVIAVFGLKWLEKPRR